MIASQMSYVWDSLILGQTDSNPQQLSNLSGEQLGPSHRLRGEEGVARANSFAGVCSVEAKMAQGEVLLL